MKQISTAFFAACLGLAVMSPAQAGLYTTSFGTRLSVPSECDDCASGPITFSGAGQSIDFFGTTYSDLYVGSNGYVTFGQPSSNYTTTPLDIQHVAPMIAGYYTDLDSRGSSASNVYVNTATAGQIIVTWEGMGHYSQNYDAPVTFQVLIRSDQASIPSGEGQIGFFYGTISDTSTVSAGFGDGLAASNPGEVAFAPLVPGSTLSNVSRFYTLAQGIPAAADVPEPASLALMAAGLAGLALRRRKAS